MHICVVIPSDAVTGGPESLHQLAGALYRAKVDSSVCYFPDHDAATPLEYCGYQVVASKPVDNPGTFYIIPEIYTWLAREFKHAKTAIWWLSVDSYLDQPKADKAMIEDLAGVVNYAQSAYAEDFLACHGIKPIMLTDYVNDEFLKPWPTDDQRCNLIAFNPKKDRMVKRLQESFPHLEWCPLDGMTRTQVADTLRHSKLYVDFGPHPGRDRLPREAAACGACVMTGRRGSAAYAADVPILSGYRMHEADPDFDMHEADSDFEELFLDLASSILSNYPTHREKFEHYRSWVAAQKSFMDAQVKVNFAGSKVNAETP